jgi:hypothetical protein
MTRELASAVCSFAFPLEVELWESEVELLLLVLRAVLSVVVVAVVVALGASKAGAN